jgi:hypothetical protein
MCVHGGPNGGSSKEEDPKLVEINHVLNLELLGPNLCLHLSPLSSISQN